LVFFFPILLLFAVFFLLLATLLLEIFCFPPYCQDFCSRSLFPPLRGGGGQARSYLVPAHVRGSCGPLAHPLLFLRDSSLFRSFSPPPSPPSLFFRPPRFLSRRPHPTYCFFSPGSPPRSCLRLWLLPPPASCSYLFRQCLFRSGLCFACRLHRLSTSSLTCFSRAFPVDAFWPSCLADPFGSLPRPTLSLPHVLASSHASLSSLPPPPPLRARLRTLASLFLLLRRRPTHSFPLSLQTRRYSLEDLEVTLAARLPLCCSGLLAPPASTLVAPLVCVFLLASPILRALPTPLTLQPCRGVIT